MSEKISYEVLRMIELAPEGILTLDILNSLRLADPSTLKTTLSRLNKAGKIIRLKRGVYSSIPLKDVFAAAQATFRGYIGFTSALYLHKLITEMPFTIVVVTTNISKSKTLGTYAAQAVALKDKAIGFERRGKYVLSTRAKTLFDCICLPQYAVEEEKLVESFKHAQFHSTEWQEFDYYVGRFVRKNSRKKFYEIKERIRRG